MSVAQRPESAGAQVFYATGVSFLCGVYDFQMDFTLQTTAGAQPAPVASVHLSPQLAKVMGRLLRRNVKLYQEKMGIEITLPAEVLNGLGIGDLEE